MTILDSQEKINYDQITYGSIIQNLLDDPNVTDIKIRPTTDSIGFALWVVDIFKARYRVDLSTYSEENIKEMEDFIFKAPTQLAYLMHADFGPKEPSLDAEYIYKDEAILRFNAIHESLAGSEKGIPLIAIRKSPYGLRINKEYMISTNYVDERFFDLMEVLIGASCNLMISGAVGSGKTNLLKYLARYISDQESIITIEDTRELFLERLYPEKEIGSLKTNSDQDKSRYEDLIKYCLRQDSQWDVVSEIRGREVSDLMESVGTGHNLISTVHADGVDEIPFRMVNMAKEDGTKSRNLFNQIFRDINIGIYIHYFNDKNGSHRQVKEVCEYYVDENDKKITHLIYYFDEKEQVFKTDKIQSQKIINKIIRKRIDYNKIKGVWIDG